jgi:hypothetical protein
MAIGTFAFSASPNFAEWREARFRGTNGMATPPLILGEQISEHYRCW